MPNNNANRALTIVLLAAMLGVIALAGVRRQAPQGSSNVLVTNTASQAVPVKNGTTPFNVTVANTIGQPVPVRENGSWYVAMTGVPNVHVANTGASPVLTKATDEEGRNAFIWVVNDSIPANSGVNSETLPAVQTGQRLIVTHIGVRSVAQGQDIPASYGFLEKSTGGNFVGNHSFGFTVPAGASQISIANLDCFFPINAGDVAYIGIERSDIANAGSALSYTIEVEGYYVSVP